jgi:hypothetical protein
MVKQIALFLPVSWLLIAGLAACGVPVAAQPVETRLIQASVVAKEPTVQVHPDLPVATGEPEGDLSLIQTPAATNSQAILPPPDPTPILPCDRAQAGDLLDVTVPDDTLVQPGQALTKVWRLVNSGACEWTEGYSAVWFSGEDFDAALTIPIRTRVLPGQSIDLAVDLIIPQEAGQHAGFWMLQNERGHRFGIGPSGESPFWVRVQVAAVSSPTVEPTVAATATPIVLVRVELTLPANEAIDLDSGTPAQNDDGDLTIKIDDNRAFLLLPVNGARLSYFGENLPTEQECRSLNYDGEDVKLAGLLANSSLCYRTNEGLPGTVRVIAFDDTTQTATIELITWAVP